MCRLLELRRVGYVGVLVGRMEGNVGACDKARSPGVTVSWMHVPSLSLCFVFVKPDIDWSIVS